jgi:DNA-binding transcriptional ArsR family regulator
MYPFHITIRRKLTFSSMVLSSKYLCKPEVKALNASPNISDVAALIADPSRAAILMTLLGGQTLLASELARIAVVTPQTASFHLTKMVDGGLLVSESHGRNRYFRLASPEIAHVLEALAIVAKPAQVRSLRQSDQTRALRFARTCYDHLAGEVGVAVTSRMLALGWLIPDDREFKVTDQGAIGLLAMGVDVAGLRVGRRAFARQCLDWSERRYHAAGVLGAAITTRFFELGWIERIPGIRAVAVTESGAEGLLANFDIRLAEVRNESA